MGRGRDSLNSQGLVLFLLEDGSHLPVSAALRRDYAGLTHRDEPAIVESGITVTLRFDVGRTAPFSVKTTTLIGCAVAGIPAP